MLTFPWGSGSSARSYLSDMVMMFSVTRDAMNSPMPMNRITCRIFELGPFGRISDAFIESRAIGAPTRRNPPKSICAVEKRFSCGNVTKIVTVATMNTPINPTAIEMRTRLFARFVAARCSNRSASARLTLYVSIAVVAMVSIDTVVLLLRGSALPG